MERTEYFNDTRPTQTQLNNTEDSKVDAILRRQRSTAQLGTVIGFQVTPNAVDATLIDIGPGEGYTGGMYTRLNVKGDTSSERIASDTSMITGQALVDYTNGVKNYVSLIYTETTDTPLDEITYPFVAHDTLAHEAYSVSVISETDWNLLTLTQLRLRILVAIVTAKGAGVPLTAAAIQQVVQPKNLPVASQPITITGITINNVADTTPIGSGTLRWEISTQKLYWTAPGDTEGVGVVISTSGAYTIYSNTVTYWIVIYAVSASLPIANQTDIITIQSMYGTTFPRYSAIDSVHREMLGHGVPSIYNPHGLNESDISGAGFDHAALFHTNGISFQADLTQLSSRIDPDPVVNQVLVKNLGGRLNSFLITGNTYTDIDGISSGSEAIVSFDIAPPISGEYMIYLDDAANLQKVFIGTVLWSVNIYLVDIRNAAAGAGAVITWDATAKTLTYAASGEAAGTAVYLMGYDGLAGYYGYYKLYSSTLTNWVIVYVGGALGGNNSTTFSTSKSEITNADNNILKLAVVAWDLGTQVLSNIRDIRQWGTADWRERILEEHDANGRHTKVFREPLRAIVQTGPTFSAYAVISPAVAAGAPNTAVLGQGDTAVGVMGSATTVGVFGTAATVGVQGLAPNTAGRFSAATQVGILALASDSVAGSFSAPNYAIIANAATAQAIYASAPNYAVFATAATGNAVQAQASGFYAINASAAQTAILAQAATVQAVRGSAENSAIYGEASTACAFFATAANSALIACATTAQAIYATAPNNAISAVVATQNAVYAQAGISYAINASAPTSAMRATASDHAVVGNALSYVINAAAADKLAFFADAPNSACYFRARTQEAVYASAPLGAVYVHASNSAIIAHADTVQAVYAEAPNYAVYASAATNYAIYATSPSDCAIFAGGAWCQLDQPVFNAAGALVSYFNILIGPVGGATMYRIPLYATP